MKTIVLQGDKVKNIVDIKKEGKLSGLTHAIYFDELKPAELEAARAVGLTIVSFKQALEEGEAAGAQTFD
jgi:hypothetical protein